MTSAVEDRRTRRRRESIEEILDVATEQMAEVGVAGLSLAAVARRMGVKPPSLYQYFPGKADVYDALFVRGAEDLAATLERVPDGGDPVERLRRGSRTFVQWGMAHQPLAQLLFWRPVPGFVPSPAAYQRAGDIVALTREALVACVEAGALAESAVTEEAMDLYTSLISGVLSQQLANEPGASPGAGRFERLTTDVVDLFLQAHAPDPA